MTIKQVVYAPNAPIEHVYFPLDMVISQVSRMDDAASVEVATVGREGMVGVPVLLRSDRSPLASFAQIEGEALRMPAADFTAEIEQSASFRDVLLRYADAYLVQVAQAGACSQLHSVRQRCARWLLMTQDRVNTNEFDLTHEFLGQMLGVRRATVSEIAAALQQENLIRYYRGHMTVVDRPGLEAVSCECYQIIRREHERLFSRK